MSNPKKDLRPPVKIGYRDVLGSPAYVLESGNEKVAFGNIEDVLLRLLKHFEPESMAERMAMPRYATSRRKVPKAGEGKPPSVSLNKIVLKVLTKPMTTSDVLAAVAPLYPFETNGAKIYACLWGLRRRGDISGSGAEGQKWLPKANSKAA